jgi:hypothetical protein
MSTQPLENKERKGKSTRKLQIWMTIMMMMARAVVCGGTSSIIFI